LLLIISVNKGR